MSALLQLRAIEHNFRGLKVLRGVALDVDRGQITGLIGPNGAGKSTLFNIVSGFLSPSGGAVAYDGQDITRWSVTQRSQAGLVRTFQTPQVFAHMTVQENLTAAGWLATSGSFIGSMLALPKSRREVQEMTRRAEEAAARFDLQSIWTLRAADLPAGRQRLLELARAAVTSPRLLCLDEPSSGLNTEEVAALRRALELLLDAGVSILLVSHDMELMEVASSVHVLCFGEIIANGDFRSVKENPRVREAYLGI